MITNRRSVRFVVLRILKYIVLILAVFFTALPFLSMLGTAIKEKSIALASTSLLPTSFDQISFESFHSVLFKTTFGKNIVNSLVVAISSVILCTVVAALAGYAISRFRGRYFSFYSVMLLVLQMFPTVLILIPIFLIFTQIGLLNTLYSVIIVYSTVNLAFTTWMLVGFFDSIPNELEEAAMIDGSTKFRAFWQIVLPLALPGIATVAIFTFINAWNEYTMASIFLRQDAVMTMTVGLQKFVQQNTSDWTRLMAASTIGTIPALIFLFFTQRFLIAGMTAGAVKG